MSKNLIVIFAMAALAITCAYAENYAVLISGDTPPQDGAGEKNWETGEDLVYADEFWNDTFVMWETLWKFGWKDENIEVFFGDGLDWDFEANYTRYYVLPQHEGWGLDHITDQSAYRQDIVDHFDYLDGIMTTDDFLLVFTFDHGGWDSINVHVNIQLMDSLIWDYDFADMMPQNYSQRVFLMQQCNSGGFIDDLEDSTTVILTSAD